METLKSISIRELRDKYPDNTIENNFQGIINVNLNVVVTKDDSHSSFKQITFENCRFGGFEIASKTHLIKVKIIGTPLLPGTGWESKKYSFKRFIANKWIGTIEITNSKIEEFFWKLDGGHANKGLNVESSHIDNLKVVSDANITVSVITRYSSIGYYLIDRVTLTRLTISTCLIQKGLVITNSTIRKDSNSMISWVDLSQCKFINEVSRFTEPGYLEYYQLKLPAMYKYYCHKDGEDPFLIKERIRQIRIWVSNYGDEIMSRQLKPLELEAFWKYLTITSSRFNSYQYWNLTISKYTNDFGLSWFLPFALCFFLGLGSAYGISLIQEDYYLPFNWMEIYLPTHASFVDECAPNAYWAYSLEFLQRILNGFLIFQFIKAFRFHTV